MHIGKARVDVRSRVCYGVMMNGLRTALVDYYILHERGTVGEPIVDVENARVGHLTP